MASWDDIVSMGTPVTESDPEALPGGLGADLKKAQIDPAISPTAPLPSAAPVAPAVTPAAPVVEASKPDAWAALDTLGEDVKPVATVTDTPKLENDTRTETYLGQSKAGAGDAMKLRYEQETGRETGSAWTAFGNQMLGIVGLGASTAVRQDRNTSDILGDKYPRAVPNPDSSGAVMGTPGGQDLAVETFKLSEQPIETIADTARAAGIGPAKIAKARDDAGDDPQAFYANIRQLAAGEVAKRDTVKARASEALTKRGTTFGGYVAGAVTPQIPYTAGFMLYCAGGPVGMTALLAKTSNEYDNKFATDQYEVGDGGQIFRTREGNDAADAAKMGVVRAGVSMGVEVGGGQLLNAGLKLAAKPFISKAATDAIERMGIVRYATRNWKEGISRKMVQNSVNAAHAAHFDGFGGEYFEELLDPVASSLMGVSDTYSDRPNLEALKAEMGQFWSGDAQGELVVGLLGLQTLGALTGLPVTLRNSVRDKSVRQATHKFLTTAGVSKANADEIVAKDEWMDTLLGISDLPEEKAQTILAGLSDKSASVVAQVNNSFAAKRDAKNYAPDFDEAALGEATTVPGDHQLGDHLQVFTDGTISTLSDLNTGLTLGEYDIATPEGLAALTEEASQASQFNQALNEQRTQKAKFIQDAATRLGIETDVFLGATRNDVARELRDKGFDKYAAMFESGQTPGMSLGGSTYIALDAVQSAEAATQLVMHEVGVHDAISQAFKGVKNKSEITDAVIAALGRKQAMKLAAGELTRRYGAEARLAPEGEKRDAALATIPERVRKALEGENDNALWIAMEEVLASVAENGVHKDPAKRSKLENAVMNTFFKDEAVNERIRTFVAAKQSIATGDVRFFGYGNTYDANGTVEPDPNDTPPPDDGTDGGDGGAPVAPTPAAPVEQPVEQTPPRPVEQPVEPTPPQAGPDGTPAAPATPEAGTDKGTDTPVAEPPVAAPAADALTDTERAEIDRIFGYTDEEIASTDLTVLRNDLADALAEEAKGKKDLTPPPAEPKVEEPKVKTAEEILVEHEKLVTDHVTANPQKPDTIRIVESPRDAGDNRVEGLTSTGANRKLTPEGRKIDNFVTRLGRKYGVSVQRDGNRVWVDVPKRVRHSGQWIGSTAGGIAPSTRVAVNIKGDGSAVVGESDLQAPTSSHRTRISDFLTAMDGEHDGNADQAFPILTAIDAGELSFAPESPDKQRPEYDGIRNTPLPPALAKKLFKEGSRSKVDEALGPLVERGAIRSDDVNAFWASLLGEVEKYDNWVRGGAKSADELVAEREAFEKTAAEEKANAEAKAKADAAKAKKPDEPPPDAPPPAPPPDTRTAKQKMIDRMKEKLEASKKPKAPPLDLDGGTPEENKAEREKIVKQQKKQAERDELAKRANKPLTGDMGDNTAPLPGLDLEKPLDSDIPLFNPPAAPDADAARKAKLKAFLDGGRKGILPNSDEGRYKLVTEPEEIKYLHFRSRLRKFFLDNWDEYYDGAADLLVELSADAGDDADRLIRFAMEEFNDDAHPMFDEVIAEADLLGDEDDWMRELEVDYTEATNAADEKASTEYADEMTRLEAEQKAAEEAAAREAEAAKKADVESGKDVTRRTHGKANTTDPRLRKGTKFLHGETITLEDGSPFAMPPDTTVVVTDADGSERFAPFEGFAEGMSPTVWVVDIDTSVYNAPNVRVYGWGTTEDDAAEMSREWIRVANKLASGTKKVDERLFPARVGAVDPRAGATIDQTTIKDTFGLGDKVNFGKAMEGPGANDERQTWVNGLYEAFADLADMLGIPRAAVGFGGGFHMAIGVTGKGSAYAHYIPGTGTVGLTRKNGAGSLSHEWWHHLQDWMKKTLGMSNDDMFAKAATLSFPYNRSTPASAAYQKLFDALHTVSDLTSDKDAREKAESMKDGVRTQMLSDGYTEAEVQSALKGDSIPQRNTPGTAMFRAYAAYANYTAADGANAVMAFNLASRDADKGKVRYWMTAHEKMARVMANLAAVSLAERGIVNSVLNDYTFPSESTAHDLSPAGVVALSQRFGDFASALSTMWTAELPKFDAKPVPPNMVHTGGAGGVNIATPGTDRKVIRPQRNTAVEKRAEDLLKQAAGLLKAEKTAKERDRKYAASLRADGDVGRYKLEDNEQETKRDLWREITDAPVSVKVRVNRAVALMVETVRTKYQLARMLDGTGMEAYAYDIERLLKERSAYYDDDGYFGPMFDRLAGKTISKTDAEEHGLYVGIDGEVTAHTEKVPPALRGPLETAQAAWRANHPGLTAKLFLATQLGMTESEVNDKLSIGQQDTVTFALSAQRSGKKGFLVAHQAGFGKGRVLTAIMRGLDEGGILFLTERPDLWGDLGRDAEALGVTKKMFATDQTAETISFTEDVLQPDGSSKEVVVFSTPAHGKIDTKLPTKDSNRAIVNAPHGDSIVMSTYIQLSSDATKYFAALDTGKPLPAPEDNKFAAVLAYVQKGDITIIADESHNAAGEDSGSNRMLTYLSDVAQFTVFSSGTAATSIDSLTFYTPYLEGAQLYPERGVFYSALRGLGVDMVGEVVKSIVEHGAMLRFEAFTPDVHMFDYMDGKKLEQLDEYHQASITRSLVLADGLNGAAHALNVVQNKVGALFAVSKNDKSLRPNDEVVGMSSAMTSRSAYNNISGLAKGLTEQGWLASKIDQVVRQVITDVNSGIAPSLALFNTNNSLLDEFEIGDDVAAVSILRAKCKAAIEKLFVITRAANQEGTMAGDSIGEATYDLRKWEDIDRLNDRFGNKYIGLTNPKTGTPKAKYTKRLPSSAADDMQDAYEQVTDAVTGFLDQLESASFTMSPMDTLREQIEAHGIKVVEATGRTSRVVAGKKKSYDTSELRNGKVMRRVPAAFAAYNAQADGRIVMIYNTAANSGVSGHLTLKTPNQARRRTYFLQIPPDPAKYEQMIFRFSRKNQIESKDGRDMRPEVFFFPSPVPAEKRMMENMKKKIDALSAVTSGAKSARLAVGDENMVNEYGDRAARQIALGVFRNALESYDFDTEMQIGNKSGEYLMEFLLRVQAMPTAMQTEILDELDSTVRNIEDDAIQEGTYHGAVEEVVADKVKPSLVTDRGYIVAMITTMATRTLEDIAISARKEWVKNRASAVARLNDDLGKVMDLNTTRPLPRAVYGILKDMSYKLNLTGDADDGNLLIYGSNRIFVVDFGRAEGANPLSLDGYIIHAYAQNGRKLAIRLSRLYILQRSLDGKLTGDYDTSVNVDQATTPFFTRYYGTKRPTTTGQKIVDDVVANFDAADRERYVGDSKHYIVGKTIRDLGRGLGELIVPTRQMAVVAINFGGTTLPAVQVGAYTDILPDGTFTDFSREPLISEGYTHEQVTPNAMIYHREDDGKERMASAIRDDKTAETFGIRVGTVAHDIGLKRSATLGEEMNAVLGGKLDFVSRVAMRPKRVASGEEISEESLSTQFAATTASPDVEDYELVQNPAAGHLAISNLDDHVTSFGVPIGGKWIAKTADELGAVLAENVNTPFVVFETDKSNALFYRVGNTKGELQQITREYAERLGAGVGAVVGTGEVAKYSDTEIQSAIRMVLSPFDIKLFKSLGFKNVDTMYVTGTTRTIYGRKEGRSATRSFNLASGMYGVGSAFMSGYYFTGSKFARVPDSLMPRVIAANLLNLSRNNTGQSVRLLDVVTSMNSAVPADIKQAVTRLIMSNLKAAASGSYHEDQAKPTGSSPVLAGSGYVFAVNKAATAEDYWEVIGKPPAGYRVYLESRVTTDVEAVVPDKSAGDVYIGQVAVLRRRGDKLTILDQAVIGPKTDGFALDMSISAIEDHNNEIWERATVPDTGLFKLEDLDANDQRLLDAFTKGFKHYENGRISYGSIEEAIVEGVTGGFRDATDAQRAAMSEAPYEIPSPEDHTHAALAEQAVAILTANPYSADDIATRVLVNREGPESLMTDLERVVLTLGRQMVNRKARQASMRASAASASPASAKAAMEALGELVKRDTNLRRAQEIGGTAAGRALNAIKASFTPALDLIYRIGAAERTLGRPLTEAEVAALRTEIDTLKAEKSALEATIELLHKQQDGKTGKTGPAPKPTPRVSTLAVRSKVAAHHNANPTMSPDEIFTRVAGEMGVSVSTVAKAFSATGRFSLEGKGTGDGAVRDAMSDWWKQAEARAAELSKDTAPAQQSTVEEDDDGGNELPEDGNIALEAVKLAVDNLGPTATRDDIVTEAMRYVKDTSIGEMSVSEFERAVIQYEKHAEVDNRTPQQRRVSELKTELLWRQRYFDILNGIVPEKRGKPPTPHTQEAREWHREFAEKFAQMLKDGTIPESEKSRLLASFNTRLRTTLENRIADLSKAINAGELIPASERRDNKWSDENIALKAEVDELKKLYDSMDVVKEVLDENRVKNANVRLAYWQTRRADAEKGIFKGKKPTQPVSDRLREIRDRIAAVQDEVRRLKAENPAQVAERVAAYVKKVYAEIDAIDARIAAGVPVRNDTAPQSAYQIASAKEREALRLARLRERDAWRAENADLYEGEREQTRILMLNTQIDAAEARIAAGDYIRDVKRSKRPFNKEIYEKERKLKELNERIRFESDKLEHPTVFAANALNAVYRFVRQSLDFSAIGLQAADTLRNDLVFNGGAGAREILSEAWLGTKDASQVGRIVHELLNDPEIIEAVHFGLDITRVFDELTGGSLAEYMVRQMSDAAPVIRPVVAVIDASQRHFLVTSLLARVQEYKQLLRAAPAGFEWSETEKRLFVSVANTATGSGDVRILGLGSRQRGNGLGKILWAARLTASQVQRALLMNGILGFGAERGVFFRNDVSGEFKRAVIAQNLKTMASYVALTVALKLLLGALGWSKPEDDPNEEGWLDFLFDPVNIGGVEIDLSGRVQTMRRSLAKLVPSAVGSRIGLTPNTISPRSGNRSGFAEDPYGSLARMTQGRLSPDLAFALSIAFGRTPFGDPFGPLANDGKRAEGFANMGLSMMPLAVAQSSEINNSRGVLATTALIAATLAGLTTGATATPDYRMNLHRSRMSLYKKETDPDKRAAMLENWNADIARDAAVAPLITQANRAKKDKDTARYEALAGVVEGMLQ